MLPHNHFIQKEWHGDQYRAYQVGQERCRTTILSNNVWESDQYQSNERKIKVNELLFQNSMTEEVLLRQKSGKDPMTDTICLIFVSNDRTNE